MNNKQPVAITSEEIAAARAAIDAKPAGAELVPTPYDVIDRTGQVIHKGELAWRYFGRMRYDGPPDKNNAGSNMMTRDVLWASRSYGERKGWAP